MPVLTESGGALFQVGLTHHFQHGDFAGAAQLPADVVRHQLGHVGVIVAHEHDAVGLGNFVIGGGYGDARFQRPLGDLAKGAAIADGQADSLGAHRHDLLDDGDLPVNRVVHGARALGLHAQLAGGILKALIAADPPFVSRVPGDEVVKLVLVAHKGRLRFVGHFRDGGGSHCQYQDQCHGSYQNPLHGFSSFWFPFCLYACKPLLLGVCARCYSLFLFLVSMTTSSSTASSRMQLLIRSCQ
jgi:hypothetical protein